MKKYWAFILFCCAGVVWFSLRPDLNQGAGETKATSSLESPIATRQTKKSQLEAAQTSELTKTVAEGSGAALIQKNSEPSSSTAAQLSVSPARAVAKQALKKIVSESGPSIGNVRVLGHRGCDVNTRSWFLSVGKPEQYSFTVSDDGDTLAVEPNIPDPTGNFEFVHCVDPAEVIGKQVRFTASIKANEVTQTARLRLRGEDSRKELKLSATENVTGTYDWKEFSVEAEVGPEVALFSYGLTFKSKGKLWISHPVFSVAE